MFVNLVGNAVDAIGAQGRLSFRIHRAGKGLRVDVTDSGPGIAPDQIERLFQHFFTTKVAGEATGLGLSVVREIVSRHNGSSSCPSVLGEGTTCTIRLPAAKAVDHAAVAELSNGVGAHFDPDMVAAFSQVFAAPARRREFAVA